jgi:hypothetical protein
MNAAEKALYPLGAVATGIAGAGVLKEGMSRPSLSEKIKREAREDSDKAEELRRKQEPSGGGGGESTARPKVMKAGGKVSSASSRADGCAVKGKTKGRMI